MQPVRVIKAFDVGEYLAAGLCERVTFFGRKKTFEQSGFFSINRRNTIDLALIVL